MKRHIVNDFGKHGFLFSRCSPTYWGKRGMRVDGDGPRMDQAFF